MARFRRLRGSDVPILSTRVCAALSGNSETPLLIPYLFLGPVLL